MNRLVAAWVNRLVSHYKIDKGRFAWRFGLRGSARAVLVAETGMVLIHLLMNALGLLPYPLIDALLIGSLVTVPITAIVTFNLMLSIGAAIQKLTVSRDEFERLSATDQLSGLANRRAFFKGLEEMPDDGILAVFDIDRFKHINDTYGHIAGDDVIRGVARVLSAALEDAQGPVGRATGHVGRLGGEEFAVALAKQTEERHLALIERARATVADATFNADSATIKVTVSAGIAEFRPGSDMRHVYRLADRAMYCAKASGRNRVVHERDIWPISSGVAGPEPKPATPAKT